MNLSQDKVKVALWVAWAFVFFYTCQKNSLEGMEKNLAQVTKKVGPSVVCIVAKNESSGKVTIGSGVILKEGYILTTENILDNVDNITVKLQNGRVITNDEVKKIFCDFETNISLIQIEAKDLTPVEIMEGEEIPNGTVGIALGNTNYSKGLQVSLGTVSHSWIGGADAYDENLLIWNGAKVPYPGGTPVFNPKGELLGITDGKPKEEDGVMFMVPAATCLQVSEVLKKDGEVKRGWIGIFSKGRCGKSEQTEEETGVLITEIAENSPAFQSGLKVGDRIVKFNKELVKNSAQLRKLVSTSQIGAQVILSIIRNGEPKEREIVIKTAEYDGMGMRRCPHRSI
jgi:S1-C subfamily serine protease